MVGGMRTEVERRVLSGYVFEIQLLRLTNKLNMADDGRKPGE